MREFSAYDSLVGLLENFEDRPPIVYENQEPDVSTPYLVVDNIPIGPRILSLKHATQYAGVLQISVITMGGQGTGQSEEVASRIAELYPAGMIHEGVRILMPPHVEKGYPDSGLWRQPIKIRWRVLPE